MDLDALIARRPQIALVDELAHTNAPGSRHPKRYLDVEELLSHGIDVYTAVNIQHIESLNDVVAQITHVRVRETVPDSVFDRADAIELIDLTPDDLIQRLKEGKVYVPKQAERALEHYFSPGNLTALRELALRRTAERVDEQLLTHMQANAIAGPWAAGERILVCISEDPRVGRAGALHPAAGGPAACAVDRAQHRDAAQPAAHRRRARPAGRYAAPGRGAGRRGADDSRRRTPHRRRRHRLRAGQQRHPDRDRQVDAVLVVRTACAARWCTIWCGAPAISACNVIAGDELRPSRSPRRRCGRRIDPSRSIRNPI